MCFNKTPNEYPNQHTTSMKSQMNSADNETINYHRGPEYRIWEKREKWEAHIADRKPLNSFSQEINFTFVNFFYFCHKYISLV